MLFGLISPLYPPLCKGKRTIAVGNTLRWGTAFLARKPHKARQKSSRLRPRVSLRAASARTSKGFGVEGLGFRGCTDFRRRLILALGTFPNQGAPQQDSVGIP